MSSPASSLLCRDKFGQPHKAITGLVIGAIVLLTVILVLSCIRIRVGHGSRRRDRLLSSPDGRHRLPWLLGSKGRSPEGMSSEDHLETRGQMSGRSIPVGSTAAGKIVSNRSDTPASLIPLVIIRRDGSAVTPAGVTRRLEDEDGLSLLQLRLEEERHRSRARRHEDEITVGMCQPGFFASRQQGQQGRSLRSSRNSRARPESGGSGTVLGSDCANEASSIARPTQAAARDQDCHRRTVVGGISFPPRQPRLRSNSAATNPGTRGSSLCRDGIEVQTVTEGARSPPPAYASLECLTAAVERSSESAEREPGWGGGLVH